MESTSDKERRGGLSRRRFFGSVAGGATEAALIGTTVGVGARAETQEAPAAEAVRVALNVNGQPYTSWRSRAGRCSTCCATGWVSPAPSRGASAASAAPAPCSSTAWRAMPA